MIAWALSLFAGFSLRLKLGLIAIGVGFISAGFFFLRWKIAQNRATTAEQKAAALQATRDLEQRIAKSRAKTRERQDKIRTEILERKKRDYYER